MLRMKFGVLAVALAGVSAYAQMGRPGALSGVEGQVSIEGRALSMRSVGTTGLDAGYVLATANGKAEVMLTPSAFLRVGSDATVKMVSPEPGHTEVSLMRGQAEVEVGWMAPEDRILIDLPQGQTQLMERGVYRFDAETNRVRVFDGKARVYPGADLTTDIKPIEVKGSHELSVAANATPQHFDRDKAEDDLYRWGTMRSSSMGEGYQGEVGYYPAYYPAYYYPAYYPGYYGGYYPYGYGFYGIGFYGGYYGGWGRGFYGGGYYGGGFRGGGGGGVHPGGHR